VDAAILPQNFLTYSAGLTIDSPQWSQLPPFDVDAFFYDAFTNVIEQDRVCSIN
jgi:hypothetical protein